MAQERGVLYGLVVYANRRVSVRRHRPGPVPRADDPRGAGGRRVAERAALHPPQPGGDRRDRAAGAQDPAARPAGGRAGAGGLVRAAGFRRRSAPRRRSSAGTGSERAKDPEVLQLSRDALLRKDAEGVDDERFPRHLVIHGVDYALDYHFEPGSANDGVTMTVPLHLLNQVDEIRCEWLVPGMLAAKVEVLLKSLPQRYRRHLLPLAQTAADFVDAQARAGRWRHVAAAVDGACRSPASSACRCGQAGGIPCGDVAGPPDDELPGGRRARPVPRDVASAAAVEGATRRHARNRASRPLSRGLPGLQGLPACGRCRSGRLRRYRR